MQTSTVVQEKAQPQQPQQQSQQPKHSQQPQLLQPMMHSIDYTRSSSAEISQTYLTLPSLPASPLPAYSVPGTPLPIPSMPGTPLPIPSIPGTPQPNPIIPTTSLAIPSLHISSPPISNDFLSGLPFQSTAPFDETNDAQFYALPSTFILPSHRGSEEPEKNSPQQQHLVEQQVQLAAMPETYSTTALKKSYQTYRIQDGSHNAIVSVYHRPYPHETQIRVAQSEEFVPPPLPKDVLLSLIHYNVIRGIAANLSYLGLSFRDVYIGAISPFVKTKSEDQEWLNSIPPTLKPTKTQLSKLHHPWMDFFPDAHLRDVLINANDRFNRPQLCADFMGNGVGFEARPGAILCGEPSDPMSWEFTEQFLKKWGWLFKDCPIVLKATNHWREDRGDPPIEIVSSGAMRMATKVAF
jgi:hypothetical protein